MIFWNIDLSEVTGNLRFSFFVNEIKNGICEISFK